MKALALLAPLAIVLAGCGGHGTSNRQEGQTMDSTTLAKLDLTSSAFTGGQPIPQRYSCDGGNEVPSLSWSEPPAGTKSFALVIDDPDAPSGTFRHWGVFDIPADARSIGGNTKTGTEVKNDKGTPGYTGPCPPPGHGIHHYHFKLFALPVDKLGLDAGSAKIADVEEAAGKQALAQGELIGTYERK